jgi:membrane-associated protease RseP (regulator of RpoE activity)
MMTIGVLAFVVALLVSVMIHEAGHFVTAKLFGMKATQFFVGFGPTLWSRQRGETEYGIKAIPAGGFVKIIGMTPLEDVSAEDQPRAFINKPGWQRFIVLVAGSTMHFVIALVLFFVALLIWPTVVSGPAKVHAVQPCVTAAANNACTAGDPSAPAKGILQAGDLIVSVNGHPVTKGSAQLISLTQANGDKPLVYGIKRNGTAQSVTVTPVVVGGKVRVGIEINDTALSRLGPAAAAPRAFDDFGQVFTGSFAALGKVPHELGTVFASKQKQRTIDGGSSVTSVVGVARVVGEGFSSTGLSGGLATLVETIASVNLFVGIFNLFPFLPLDGGHVAILGYEKIRDAWRRRRHLAAAGPVDLTKLMPVTYGVLAIIVTMSALILIADITNPVANPFTQ